MATIAENIQTLRSIKSDIKNAIIQKGGSVTDAFGTYAQAITNLPSGGGGGTEIEDGLITRTLSVYSNDRVSMVGQYAFYYYRSLASVNLPNCTSVGNCAFAYCNFSFIDLPLCSYIGGEAFSSCHSLISVNLPKVTSLDGYAFYNCSALQSIDLPLCSFVKASTFEYCKALSYVNLPNCIETSGQAFYGCYSLTTVNLSKCTLINWYTFGDCSALPSIDLPKCAVISDYGFAGCTALSIVKSPLCYYLNHDAFNGCTNLKEVYLNSVSSVTQMPYSNTFSNCPNLTSIYVPASLVDAFKTAQNWSSISDKIVAYREVANGTDDFDHGVGGGVGGDANIEID